MSSSSIQKGRIISVAEVVVIFLLFSFNVYLYITKAIPGAMSSSVDLRYTRAVDFSHHIWAGVEEFPSMLICVLSLALFPSVETAKTGWLVANFIFCL